MTSVARRIEDGPVQSNAIRALLPGIAEPRERIEATFVGVGARLSEGAGMLNRITRVFEALPAELESPELNEATARLAAVGRRAGAISAGFATEQADLARLVSVVAAADHPISDLRRTVKMMGIVAINARVVAAGIVGDADDFDVFTTDIAKLSDGASRTIQEFSTVYRQLTDEVQKAASQRAHFEASHADTLSGMAARMEQSLAIVTQQRQASADGSAETGRVSRQIAGRIAAAVMALQVGDATRQRLEHVETALETLADLVDGHAVKTLTLEPADHAGALGAIASLQADQLDDAAISFHADVAEASAALQDLATDAGIIMTRSRDIYGQDGNAGQSSLTLLSAQLRQAAAVLRDCETERAKLEEVAAAVSATVRVLLGHVEAVQEIEANMRLVSLNAAVKCAQLGPRGTALNVIARQLRELTGETVAAAEAAMTSLREAAALGQSFGAAATGDAAGQVGQLEQEATAAIGLLETVDKRLEEALVLLTLDGPKVIALLGAAADGFDGHEAIAEAMADMRVRIVELAATVDRQDTPESVSPILSLLRTNYTMDAERRIHESLFGKEPGAETSVAFVNAAPEAEMDDIFF